jgi:hypothetical protein
MIIKKKINIQYNIQLFFIIVVNKRNTFYLNLFSSF